MTHSEREAKVREKEAEALHCVLQAALWMGTMPECMREHDKARGALQEALDRYDEAARLCEEDVDDVR